MDENKNAPAATAPEDKEISKSPVAEKKSPAPAPSAKARPRIRKEFVVSGNATDDVSIARLNARDAKRKSLSVLHLQRALAWHGFDEAAADIGGKFGALTAIALGKWQDANGFAGDVDEEQAGVLFADDPNVSVIP